MSNRGRHKKSNKHLIVQILGENIANRMMECQIKQGNPPNLDVFLIRPDASITKGGFNWRITSEGFSYWCDIAYDLQSNLLYKQYKNGRS